MGDKKIKKIKEKLQLPDDFIIPKRNKLSEYNKQTKERTEVQVLNSCYHIAHNKKFTNYFQNKNGIIENEN